MQPSSDTTNRVRTADSDEEERTEAELEAELRQRCIDGWQLHRELAAMQAALRATQPSRSVLPAGLQARAIVPRELAAPFVPSGPWHQLLVTADYAFACSGATRLEQLLYDDVHRSIRKQIKDTTERTLRLQRVEQDTRWDNLLPTEVVSCLHPVRFYQPPDQPAFACVFARSLAKGDPVALYAGVVRQENSMERWRASDVYTWELENGTHCIIDAAEKGGVARFINAEKHRLGGQSTVNCEASAALDCDLCMPAVALHATTGVEQLAECIGDYGNHYWPAITKHLLDVWDDYISMARWLRPLLADYMLASGQSSARLPVPLPSHHDEAYHWAPDEVQYPLWPVPPASNAAHRPVQAARKNGTSRRPIKRTTAARSNGLAETH